MAHLPMVSATKRCNAFTCQSLKQENHKLCSHFTSFFTNKIDNLKFKISKCIVHPRWSYLLLDFDFSEMPLITYPFKHTLKSSLFLNILSLIPPAGTSVYVTKLTASCFGVFSNLVVHMAIFHSHGCFPSCFKYALVMTLL